MSAAGFLPAERPDGHSDAMGTCYSAGKGKPSSSATFSSPPQGAVPMHTRKSPSSSGKARSTSQSLSFDTSQKALARTPSCVRDRSTDVLHANRAVSGTSVLHPTSLRHTNSSKSLAGRFQAAEVSSDGVKECTHTVPDPDSLSVMNVAPQQTSTSIGDGVPSCLTSSSSNEGDGGIGQAHVQIISSNASTSDSMLSNSSGVSLLKTLSVTSQAASSSISSPRRNMRRSTSSKLSKSETPFMLSACTELKTPNLKSGVGAYEVLTSRKLIAGVHTTPPPPLSKLDSSLRRTGSHNPAAGLKVDLVGANNMALKAESSPLSTKAQGFKEFCKNCKTGTWESVCFIANDGKITAANTGPATVCHFHHCKSPKCAANPNYQPPSLLPCKKVLLAKPRSSRCLTDKAEVKDELDAGDDRDTCSTSKSLPHEAQSLAHSLSAAEERGLEENKLAVAHAGHGSSVRKKETGFQDADGLCPNLNSLEGGAHNPKQSSPCAEKGERGADPVSLHEGKESILGPVPPCSNGANNSDHCSIVPDTPSLISKSSPFGDLSNSSLAESDAVKELQARKSNMERMRQRYLDCLKEQEAETVRLRKQEMFSRKQAGEWMLDSAIGEILQKLAPDGEAGVKVIVEAFETIMQQCDAEMQHAGDNLSCLDE